MKRFKQRLQGYKRRLIRSIFSSAAGRKIHFYGVQKDIVFVTLQADDHRITFDPHDLSIGKELYINGDWERQRTDRIIGLLRDKQLLGVDKSVLELGANIGTQTIYLHLNGAFSHVIAVEANPDNVKLLELNLRQNNLSDRSTIVACAIAQHDGEITLHLSEVNSGRHSIVTDTGSGKTVTVQGKTLNSIFDSYDIRPANIGFCWVDVEGFEFEALEQIVSKIGTDVPVFMEFSPAFYGDEKTRDFLNFIRNNYDDCYFFDSDDVAERLATSRIDTEVSQADILLLPRSREI